MLVAQADQEAMRGSIKLMISDRYRVRSACVNTTSNIPASIAAWKKDLRIFVS